MEIVHDTSTNVSNYAENKLQSHKERYYEQIQKLLLSRGITVQYLINKVNVEYYVFAGFLGAERPTIENTYGEYAIMGVTERNKRKVFQWYNGGIPCDMDSQKAIVAACRALTEMETETFNFIPETGIGKSFYEFQQTPEQRVLQIFGDVFSKKK
jgi:hypothetical protein